MANKKQDKNSKQYVHVKHLFHTVIVKVIKEVDKTFKWVDNLYQLDLTNQQWYYTGLESAYNVNVSTDYL